jgi:hypothetical protein
VLCPGYVTSTSPVVVWTHDDRHRVPDAHSIIISHTSQVKWGR